MRSTYRLCWCSCLALVLLRVGVGWHFLYEGLSKIESHREGTKPFSAEGYLANSSGPLRDWVRRRLDDPDGLKYLEPTAITAQWNETLQQLDARYGLNQEQRQSAAEKIRELEQTREKHFGNADNKKKIEEYWDAMNQVIEDESSGLAYERERAREKRRELATQRDELTTPIQAWNTALRDHVTGRLTPDQIERDSARDVGGLAATLDLPFPLWPEQSIDQINVLTMCGLTLSGGLLLVGLFSRLSALWAAAFLAMIYATNPPLPLGAGNPADPGNYLYVNKELIECLAALALATIPTGRWLGVDALIRAVTRPIRVKLFGAEE